MLQFKLSDCAVGTWKFGVFASKPGWRNKRGDIMQIRLLNLVRSLDLHEIDRKEWY
jgi:hypothetical protein